MTSPSTRAVAVDTSNAASWPVYVRALHRIFFIYVLGLVGFILLMAGAEKLGWSRQAIGVTFLFASVTLFAVIGFYCRTTRLRAFLVADRRVPAVYNGMACAADWLSAASFLSLAGGLYLQGFSGQGNQPGGLAYILGWSGGFVLLGLWVVPALRRMQLWTLPDFYRQRFAASAWPRCLAALGAVLCSLTYLIAQIYAVGLITARLTGVPFELGILLGLSSVLICSFLGGMRAITWTQVAQYVIMLIAFAVPTTWLASQHRDSAHGLFFPVLYAEQLAQVSARETALQTNSKELEVRAHLHRRAIELEYQLLNPVVTLHRLRVAAEQRVIDARNPAVSLLELYAARSALARLPEDAQAARQQWEQELAQVRQQANGLGGLPEQALAYPQDRKARAALVRSRSGHSPPHVDKTLAPKPSAEPPPYESTAQRNNFIAFMLCLMLGTVGMPHVLTRFYTAPSVSSARRAVAWSLLFIVLVYLMAPALAVMVKWEIMYKHVGAALSELPVWASLGARSDSGLLRMQDWNDDGLLQFAELQLGPESLLLMLPDLIGLPFVVAGLMAAGVLAAAVSTADGLLLTIGNVFAYDLKRRAPWSRLIRSRDGAATTRRRGSGLSLSEEQAILQDTRSVFASKIILLFVAAVAALIASLQSADILSLVTMSFSFAATLFVPSLIAGIYSPRTRASHVTAAMLLGLGVTLGYMVMNSDWLSAVIAKPTCSFLLFAIQPAASGLWGCCAGAATLLVLRLVHPAPLSRAAAADATTYP